MLLWLIVALGFVGCVVAWHMWQGITKEEATALFFSAALVFAVNQKSIYDQATTDHYLVSGHITSLIHRPPFTYKCGKDRTCREPERWILEQSPWQSQRQVNITRSIHSGDGIETCIGECKRNYPAPYSEFRGLDSYRIYSILVDAEKFARTRIGDSSVQRKPYFNPVAASDEVIFGNGEQFSYFNVRDYNRSDRIAGVQATIQQLDALEALNAKYAKHNMSIGIFVSNDTLHFEKLRRAWHQGKANDVIAVIYSPDAKSIGNVNVLGWNNYALKQNITQAVAAVGTLDVDKILAAIDSAIAASPAFAPADFSQYRFLDVKIPDSYYVKILIFQIVYVAYMLMLLRYNPNTKENKLTWQQVRRMWSRGYRPTSNSWYLHPFTWTGILLYLFIPLIAAMALI